MSSDKVIKEALKEGKVSIGRSAVLRMLKRGSLQSVIHASNCPDGTMRDLRFYAGMSKVEIERFKGDSASLGQLCGKPFSITVLGIGK
ncbi:MAG: ribosomal L7Ae/L30e/S12e/Gadd45 family protein [Candidatus Aenigmarchaeota archaeon]|nr:ribosomal L7Ae/L30e/S12e/Gadd45 family protein [Candidatus Aenigmarchaeota archaeon]